MASRPSASRTRAARADRGSAPAPRPLGQRQQVLLSFQTGAVREFPSRKTLFAFLISDLYAFINSGLIERTIWIRYLDKWQEQLAVLE